MPIAFAVLAVALHPMVEPGYALPAFFLFNLWRRAMHPRSEVLMLGAWIVVSLALLYAISTLRLFP